MNARGWTRPRMAKPLTACKGSLRKQKGRLGAPFSCRQLLEQVQQLSALVGGERGSDPALVHADSLLEARGQRASRSRQPKTVRATIVAPPALDEVPRLQGVQHPDQRGAVDTDGLRQPALRHTGIGVDEQQDAGVARRCLRDLAREIAEYRLLGNAQPITEQLGKQPSLQRLLGSHAGPS
jgi:hypothetical protein